MKILNNLSLVSVLLLLMTLTRGFSCASNSWAQEQSQGPQPGPGTLGAQAFDVPQWLRNQMNATTATTTTPPPPTQGMQPPGGLATGDPGFVDNSRVAIPFRPQVGVSYSGYGTAATSGATGPGLGLQHGGGLYGSFYGNSGVISLDARMRVVFGQGGLGYLDLDFRTVRLRFPMDRNQIVYLGAAPLDMDLRATTSPNMRFRGAWRPVILGGIMLPVGPNACASANDEESYRRCSAERRREMERTGNPAQCVFYLFGHAGSMFGSGETQNVSPSASNVITPILGAETGLRCAQVVFDFRYDHIFSFSLADVERLTGDFYAHARLPNGWHLGGFVNATMSYERPGVPTAVPSQRICSPGSGPSSGDCVVYTFMAGPALRF